VSDDWKTPIRPLITGHMNDASGHSIAFSVERDVIVIRQGGKVMRLSPDMRDLFIRLFMSAERKAEAWTKEQAEVSDE